MREQGGSSSQILSKIVHGTRHHLFLFTGLNSADNSVLTTVAAKVLQDYAGQIEVHLVSTRDAAGAPSGAKAWSDVDSLIHKKYSISKACAVLLRPDKYIGFTQMPVTEGEIVDYLNSLFIV